MKTKTKNKIKLTLWLIASTSFVVSIFIFEELLLIISLVCIILSIPFFKTPEECEKERLQNIQI